MGSWKDMKRAAQVKAKVMAVELKEKNRRAAVMNRLRAVIRCEEKAAEKEYLALGRYYYNALRNADDAIAESHCARIDGINARRDSALESLEQAAREVEEWKSASSTCVVGGADGPTAVYVSKTARKRGQIFHFDHGPVEITVTREDVYDPADENSEEVDLSDVECFDSDPTLPQPAPAEKSPAEPVAGAAEAASQPAGNEFCPAEPEFRPAELDENDSLPFE